MGYEEYLTRANTLSGSLPQNDLSPESLVLWYRSYPLIHLSSSGYWGPWREMLKRYPDYKGTPCFTEVLS